MNSLLKKVWSNRGSILVGLSSVVLFTILSFQFYTTPFGKRDSLFLKSLDSLNANSIDFRLRLRGIKEPAKNIAVVGIDDRSLKTEGRWPWSRNKISQMLEELYYHGARFVATDVLFSEKENEQISSILENIPVRIDTPDIDDKNTNKKIDEKSIAYSEAVKTFKNQSLSFIDADGQLAKTVKRHQNKTVLANNYFNSSLPLRPYQLLCYNYVYEQSPAYAAMEREAYDVNPSIEEDAVSAFPEAFTELTDSLEGFFLSTFEKVIVTATEEFCQENETIIDCLKNGSADIPKKYKIPLNYKIQVSKRKYCANWLTEDDPYKKNLEKLWPSFQEKEEVYADLTFKQFVYGLHNNGGLANPLFPADFWTYNIEKLLEVTRYSGYLNTLPDVDGTLRRFPLVVRSGDQHFPSLAFRTSMLALQADDVQVKMGYSPNNPGNLDVRQLNLMKEQKIIQTIPTDAQARLYINYHGPGYIYPHISARELFDPTVPNVIVSQKVFNKNTGKYELQKNIKKSKNEFLKNKIIFIGATAIGLYDLRVTPFDENFPGVEKHANVTDNIINNDFLAVHPNEPLYMLLGLLIAGIIFTILLSLLGALPGLILSSSIVVLLFYIDKTMFFANGWIVAMIFPIGLIFLIYFSQTIYKYFTEEKQKRELKGTFQKYVSPAIVNEVMAHPDNIQLGGRKEMMTVFFSDIRGFTTISEALDPSELSDLLNMYLTPMTDLVFSNNGTLDKYMGDAVMAFFGAPIPSNHHPADAARCALEQLERLDLLNEELKAKEWHTLEIGIGLNTGEMSVGNMGSETVRSYTVMGDAVNLGARLEGINKQYGTRIIISEFTEKLLPEIFTRREIDWVKVKGKTEPVRIFELMAEGPIAEGKKSMLAHYNKGFNLYHEMRWQEAKDELAKGMTFIKGDSVCQLYIDRCDDFVKNPPAENWDGVFTMTTK